ncbi:hypothetical protein DM860_014685 [Cuscuta australis]|uniref:Uncharacterized protein n=1 Tax=Cuscuta australis TaxID=267555 RepID=A0A328DHE0_9ASTE|nr:hypothetical protein DM860_014685 [Cuscuta australis]
MMVNVMERLEQALHGPSGVLRNPIEQQRLIPQMVGRVINLILRELHIPEKIEREREEEAPEGKASKKQCDQVDLHGCEDTYKEENVDRQSIHASTSTLDVNMKRDLTKEFDDMGRQSNKKPKVSVKIEKE